MASGDTTLGGSHGEVASAKPEAIRRTIGRRQRLNGSRTETYYCKRCGEFVHGLEFIQQRLAEARAGAEETTQGLDDDGLLQQRIRGDVLQRRVDFALRLLSCHTGTCEVRR